METKPPAGFKQAAPAVVRRWLWPVRRPGESIRILDGWAKAAFFLAVLAPVLTLGLLVIEYGGKLTPIEVAGWLAAPIGFGFYLYVALARVPACFQSIEARQLLGTGEYKPEFGALEAQLTEPRRWHLGLSIVTATPVLLGYMMLPKFISKGPRDSDPWSGAELAEIGVATYLALVAGSGLWRMFVTGRYVHGVGNDSRLRVWLRHPDHCAGLEALGRICLDNALVLAVPGGLLVFGIVQSALGSGGTSPPVYGVLLILVMALAATAFVGPMLSVHRAMGDRTRPFAARLERHMDVVDALAREIAGRVQPTQELRELNRELEFRRDVYRRNMDIPIWPIRFRSWATFAASQAVGVLALLVSVEQLLKP